MTFHLVVFVIGFIFSCSALNILPLKSNARNLSKLRLFLPFQWTLRCAPQITNITPPSGIKAKLAADMKESMKAKQKERLSAIRAIQTAIKQKEVDDRVDVE